MDSQYEVLNALHLVHFKQPALMPSWTPPFDRSTSVLHQSYEFAGFLHQQLLQHSFTAGRAWNPSSQSAGWYPLPLVRLLLAFFAALLSCLNIDADDERSLFLTLAGAPPDVLLTVLQNLAAGRRRLSLGGGTAWVDKVVVSGIGWARPHACPSYNTFQLIQENAGSLQHYRALWSDVYAKRFFYRN